MLSVTCQTAALLRERHQRIMRACVDACALPRTARSVAEWASLANHFSTCVPLLPGIVRLERRTASCQIDVAYRNAPCTIVNTTVPAAGWPSGQGCWRCRGRQRGVTYHTRGGQVGPCCGVLPEVLSCDSGNCQATRRKHTALDYNLGMRTSSQLPPNSHPLVFGLP